MNPRMPGAALVKRIPLPLFILIILFVRAALGQSPNGTISGLVLDPAERAIVGAEVLIVNDATGVKYAGTTNREGIYAIPNLAPGPYRIQVSKVGFKTLIKPDVVLNVQAAVAINFTLPVGAVYETLTVTGGTPLINTESGSVSTVIDRSLVENLPLNGRSFNTLLQLTPGVVIAQAASNNQGQFSVAGQRTSANNFLIDGVSANFGVAPTVGLGTTGTGAAQAFSALGGTSSLISVVAIDVRQNKVRMGSWRNVTDRPIYFVELRDGYACCWCELDGNQLILIPCPQSPVQVRQVRYPTDGDIVGRVTAVTMPLVEVEQSSPGDPSALPHPGSQQSRRT